MWCLVVVERRDQQVRARSTPRWKREQQNIAVEGPRQAQHNPTPNTTLSTL